VLLFDLGKIKTDEKVISRHQSKSSEFGSAGILFRSPELYSTKAYMYLFLIGVCITMKN
jgi:hypothetical protein